MKIGVIGAGRMGFTLGKHLSVYSKNAEDVCVMGYYSRQPDSAKKAAKFTDTKYYKDMKALVQACDTIILTVPDGQIQTVFNEIKNSGIRLDGKTFIHTSGALSSQIFSGMGNRISGYSIHPIYAVNSKTESYKHFQNCYITIEGEGRDKEQLIGLFKKMGHKVREISAEKKAEYHAAAVFVSNLAIGLYRMGTNLLSDCGFTKAEAQEALMPLFANNADNMQKYGCDKALTGPVSRNDVKTVEKHLKALDFDAETLEVYRLLSKQLCSDKNLEIIKKLDEGVNHEKNSYDIC